MCKSLGWVPITTREKRKEGKEEEGLKPEPLALTPAHFEPIQLIAAELFPDDPPASASRDEAGLKTQGGSWGGGNRGNCTLVSVVDGVYLMSHVA